MKNISLFLIGALMALVGFGAGCATDKVNRDVVSVSRSQQYRDLSTQTDKEVAGVYYSDSAKTSVCLTNADGSIFQDHSTETSKGFRSPVAAVLHGIGWVLGSSCSYSVTYSGPEGPEYCWDDGEELFAYYNGIPVYWTGFSWAPAGIDRINRFRSYQDHNRNWANDRRRWNGPQGQRGGYRGSSDNASYPDISHRPPPVGHRGQFGQPEYDATPHGGRLQPPGNGPQRNRSQNGTQRGIKHR
jgi:hypothetical protein